MAAGKARRPSKEDLVLNGILSPDRSDGQHQTLLSGQAIAMEGNGLMSPPARPESLASRASNRLSLSLPVQAGERDAAWLTRRAPTDSESSTRQASPSLEVNQNPSRSTSNDLLVALAAQERKVLELKEELHRAESQLNELKRQWAMHEMSRNKSGSGDENAQVELRQVTPATLGIDTANSRDMEDKVLRRSLNMDVDQRKAMPAGATKDSRRKVISGGHTRTLSLLSPIQSHHNQNIPVSQELNIGRATTADGTYSGPTRQISTSSNTPILRANKSRHSYQGSTTIGVKQIAEDIKSGLWTFMEDLRQATVGEEAIKGLPLTNAEMTAKGPGRKASRVGHSASDRSPIRNLHKRPPASNVDETVHERSILSDDSLELAQDTKTTTHESTSAGKKLEPPSSVDDDWSNWDSPDSRAEAGRWSNGTNYSSQHTSNKSSPYNESKESNPAAVVNHDLKHDDTAWSSLNNFMPSNIKRTASAIIKEWEKSLTPPSVDERQDLLSNSSKAMKKASDEDSRLLLNNLP